MSCLNKKKIAIQKQKERLKAPFLYQQIRYHQFGFLERCLSCLLQEGKSVTKSARFLLVDIS
jgi:hypothetical protein